MESGRKGGQAPSPPEVEMLAVHAVVRTNFRKAQHMLGTLVNPSRHSVHETSQDQLRKATRPLGPDNPIGEEESKPSPRHGTRAYTEQELPHAFRCGHPDLLRVIPASSIAGIRRRFMEIAEHKATRWSPCCDSIHVATRNSRIFPERRCENTNTTSFPAQSFAP